MFKNSINKKFLSDYGHNVFLPLTKMKNWDIKDLNFRADFNQVVYLKPYS